MLRILLIGIGAVVIGRLLLWVADRSWPIVSFPLRAAVGLAAALMAFLGYSFFVNEEDGPISFVVGGAILLVLATHLIWRLAFRQSRTESKPAIAAIGTATVPSTLGNGEWTQFLRDLGWLRRQRALGCRARIEQFLTVTGEQDLDCHHRELVIALERRVPELLREWKRCCARADVGERRAYSERTLAILEALASEADNARGDLQESGDRAFDTLERYFSRFSQGDRRPG